MLILPRFRAADAGPDQHPYLPGVLGGDGEMGIFQSQPRGRVGKLYETIVAADFFLFHEGRGVEVAHLGRNPRIVPGGVEATDPPHSAPRFHQTRPEALLADPDGGDDPHPGHNDPAPSHRRHLTSRR